MADHSDVVGASPHDDAIKWKRFSCYWPSGRGIHQWPVEPLTGKGKWSKTFSLNCAWTNGLANNRDADDLRRYRAHYDANVKVGLRRKKNEWAQRSAALHEVWSDLQPSGDSSHHNPWWRHDMETLSALLALCEGNPPLIGPPHKVNNSKLCSFLCC